MTTNLQPDDLLRERYRIVGLIGRGGMGAVYLADDNRLSGRQCAIKETEFSPTLSKTVLDAARKQFYQEASILAQLDHPGLPKVSDYFSIHEHDYLVMDFIPGNNLQELIQVAQKNRQFLDQETVLVWVEQLCDTLNYLHSRQNPVLHRDIKPANIKLTPDNRLKLVDFGLVKPLDPHDPNTLTGLQGMGSLPYAPLEQYLDHLGHTDARSDLYALGATTYHLLTNRMPTSAQERFLDPTMLPPPSAINQNVSPRLSDLILKAMAAHPKDRPTSVLAWQREVYNARTTVPLSANSSKRRNLTKNKLRENLWLLGVALSLLLAALWLTFLS